MKYLYVLVSTHDDIYYEQFMLSITSLKFFLPDAETVLLCDTQTKKNLVGIRSEYKNLVSKVIAVDPPEYMSQIDISRWVKTSMRSLISGDFLFIDCDTVITGDISCIERMDISFAACLDKHSLISAHAKSSSIIENEKKLGSSAYISNRHFNSGVIFSADTPEIHAIFDRWHELWLLGRKKNIIRDQPAFNMAIYENEPYFTELDGIWNCQIAFNGLPYLADSMIIHYFASDLNMHESPFIFACDEIFNKIKSTGKIPNETLELLKNPKTAFVPESRIIAGYDMLDVINSSLFETIALLKKKAPYLFNYLNRFGYSIKKIVKCFSVMKSRKNDGGIKHYY